jgi:hypothetical protein
LKTYKAAQSIAERLATADPGNAGWQSDLSNPYNITGGALKTQGEPAAAPDSFRRRRQREKASR